MRENKINVYVCNKCGGNTVTIDVDEGVTPLTIKCRAKGMMGECSGWAESCFYCESMMPEHISLVPKWEWFRPTGDDYERLSPTMKTHVDKGGLEIREIAKEGENK